MVEKTCNVAENGAINHNPFRMDLVGWHWIVARRSRRVQLRRQGREVMYGWRRFWFRIFGAKIGTNVLLRPSVRMTYPWKVTIGDYSWLGDGVELYSLDTITIGSNVVVSQNTYICTGTHDYGVASFDMVTAPICIKDQAWVASDVFIHPGVTIGEACVVGARSTVGKDMPAGMLCVGSPCEVVRSRHA